MESFATILVGTSTLYDKFGNCTNIYNAKTGYTYYIHNQYGLNDNCHTREWRKIELKSWSKIERGDHSDIQIDCYNIKNYNNIYDTLGIKEVISRESCHIQYNELINILNDNTNIEFNKSWHEDLCGSIDFHRINKKGHVEVINSIVINFYGLTCLLKYMLKSQKKYSFDFIMSDGNKNDAWYSQAVAEIIIDNGSLSCRELIDYEFPDITPIEPIINELGGVYICIKEE